ncbi:Pex12 amino terminal region-domain-containing protein [Podospora didyma]|uniref:Peroxisome assembly protein 12 n=1 Tax=Podospora didyma TaxID=330526 RepID=A0AAE0NZC4_9PEZI|nr:Pex12 amino terminal region-domain-containing protein [Podospora didyma]
MEFVTALRGSFDDGKPSLFELLSEQQLAGLLPSTLRYLLTVATHRYPRHLLRVLNSFDELYALAALIVERHYLRSRGGSFTENFYGLKREKALAADIPRASAQAPSVVRNTLRLANGDIWRNLAVMVGLPYLKRKLDEAYEVDAPRTLLGAAYTRLPAGATWKDRFLHHYRWFLRNLYPSVNAAYYFALLAFNLAYLFDNTRYHNPFLWLIGTRMRRMNGADYRAIEDALKPAAAAAGAAATATATSSMFSPRNISARMMGGLSLVLPTSIFALKFLEWWYASDFAKQLSRKAGESLDLPPPIVSGVSAERSLTPSATAKKAAPAQEDGEEGEIDNEKPLDAAPIAASSLLPIYTVPTPPQTSDACCPICEGEIVTPTACQTGIVYCYTCIHKWIVGTHPRQERFMTPDKVGKWESGEGRCAVTGRRVLAGTEGLRRIMV